MEQDEIRLDPHLSQRKNALFQMAEVLRIKAREVPMVAIGLIRVLLKIFRREHGGVHRRAGIGIGARLV